MCIHKMDLSNSGLLLSPKGKCDGTVQVALCIKRGKWLSLLSLSVEITQLLLIDSITVCDNSSNEVRKL